MVSTHVVTTLGDAGAMLYQLNYEAIQLAGLCGLDVWHEILCDTYFNRFHFDEKIYEMDHI